MDINNNNDLHPTKKVVLGAGECLIHLKNGQSFRPLPNVEPLRLSSSLSLAQLKTSVSSHLGDTPSPSDIVLARGEGGGLVELKEGDVSSLKKEETFFVFSRKGWRAFDVVRAVEGKCVARGASDYGFHRYQYGTTSTPDRFDPAVVIYPKGDEDILKAVAYARDRNLAIAIRTGGHQYSGASSTTGENILLDLSKTFQDEFIYNPETNQVRISVSFNLTALSERLKGEGLFVPHGVCGRVFVGGHVQTGGYGMLCRGFGLFGDCVQSLRIITADGHVREVNMTAEPDLFHAVLGGSPGNFGVLTHLTLRPFLDSWCLDPRGFKRLVSYSTARFKKLVEIAVEVNTKDLAQDFDFSVSVASFGENLLSMFPSLLTPMRKHHREFLGPHARAAFPVFIVVFAQWSNVTGGKFEDDAHKWFVDIEKAMQPDYPLEPGFITVTELNFDEKIRMPDLSKQWSFDRAREFNSRYEKRTYVSKQVQPAWPTWICCRVDKVVAAQDSRRIIVQIQPIGGENSMFFKKRTNHHAYSWRDSAMLCVMDCFYDDDEKSKHLAEAWQKENDEGLNGGAFSEDERRLLWGSYGEFDLPQVHLLYYDDEERYQKLLQVKEYYDPSNVFTPNTFGVHKSPTAHPSINK